MNRASVLFALGIFSALLTACGPDMGRDSQRDAAKSDEQPSAAFLATEPYTMEYGKVHNFASGGYRAYAWLSTQVEDDGRSHYDEQKGEGRLSFGGVLSQREKHNARMLLACSKDANYLFGKVDQRNQKDLLDYPEQEIFLRLADGNAVAVGRYRKPEKIDPGKDTSWQAIGAWENPHLCSGVYAGACHLRLRVVDARFEVTIWLRPSDPSPVLRVMPIAGYEDFARGFTDCP